MKTPPDRQPRALCPPPEEIVAALLDGAMDAEAEALRQHMAACDRCRALVEHTRRTVAALQRVPVAPRTRDLVPGVMAEIERARRTSRRSPFAFAEFWSVPLSKAAAILVLLGAAAILWRSTTGGDRGAGADAREGAAAVDRGTAWLLARQTPSGGWDVEALGGRPEYAPALNGMAMLALASSPERGAGHREALRRAAKWLAQQQAPDGRFGGEFDGTLYNQGIATLALLDSYRVTQEASLRAPIERALAYIRSRQLSNGGWAGVRSAAGPPNTAVTVWQVKALLLAESLGWAENREAAGRALAWLSGRASGNGFFAYERSPRFPDGPKTSAMMGAYGLIEGSRLGYPVDPALASRVREGVEQLARERPEDYYRSFFYAATLAKSDAAAFAAVLAEVAAGLSRRQMTEGGEAGLWQADDRLGAVGGRLYSTAMALLTLNSSGGTPNPNRDAPMRR